MTTNQELFVIVISLLTILGLILAVFEIFFISSTLKKVLDQLKRLNKQISASE